MPVRPAHSAPLNAADQNKPNTICAIRKLAQLLRASVGSWVPDNNQLYQDHAAVAMSTNTSPITKCTLASACQSPRHSTTITPRMDSTAPVICRLRTVCLKNNAPTSSMNTGMLDPTKVTLMGVEVCSAKYRKLLYKPTPSRPSKV